MNNVVSLSQLITRLAKVTDTDINTSRRFLRSLFAAVEEQLLAGESVTIKGIGTFRPNVDGLVAQGQSVLFIPDAELAAAVNAPFDMFEPVELAGGVNFDDEAEESASATPESVAAAEAPEIPEAVRAEVTEVEEVEEAEEAEEAREEESPAAVREDEVEAAVVSQPEAESEPEADSELAVAEAAPVAAPRYVFPEEEDGELPPDEPLRAPVQRNSRMWVWILLIVAGGGLLGYLFAQLDSEDDSYGVDAETEVEAPVDTATFEEVAVEELAASAAAPMPVVAEENVAPEPQPEPAPVVEAAPVENKEKPVYDTVTGTNYLAKMARKYYGRSSYWVFIYQANTDVLDNPDRIKPGTKVLIPPKSSFAEDTEAATLRKADAIRADLDRKYK